ncbi:hypothetical protein B0H14DRAFT_3515874 [Mycena olivaceomarginata]|nr:hypothetical protein B0H14DRAFT_3515874 [Mycena olivaceomarginata]
MPPLPPSIYHEIIRHSRQPERVILARVTKPLNRCLQRVLYRHIAVSGHSATKLVGSLAKNPGLPPMVHELIFQGDSAHVNAAEWASVLPAMVNMWCLGIVPGIPLSRELMSTLPFRLTCFQSIGAVDGIWSDFIASQAGLSRLYFESDFSGETPGPLELPNLVSVKGRPKDVARFAELHSLESLWVVPGTLITPALISSADFLLLLAAARDVVSLLVHLVLDEDLTWSNFTLGSDHSLVKSTFAGVATALDGQFLHLRRLILVCAVSSYGHGERRPLRLADAKCFAKILASNSGRVSAFDSQNGHSEKEKAQLATPTVCEAASNSPSRETDAVAQPWSAAMTELFAEALNWKPSDEIDEKDRAPEEDLATKKARLEEEEAGERSWERAVELCVGGMREPDRREWFRDQRIQEEYEARNAHPPSDADDSWRDVSTYHSCAHSEVCSSSSWTRDQLHSDPQCGERNTGLWLNYDHFATLVMITVPSGMTFLWVPMKSLFAFAPLRLDMVEDNDDDEIPPLVYDEEMPLSCVHKVMAKL